MFSKCAESVLCDYKSSSVIKASHTSIYIGVSCETFQQMKKQIILALQIPQMNCRLVILVGVSCCNTFPHEEDKPY